MDEVFVPVEGFPNYEVSNYGRVVNVKKGTDLVPIVGLRGALQVKLYADGLPTHFILARLVARAFFVNYSEGYCVELINENEYDVTVLNIHLTDKKVRTRGS